MNSSEQLFERAKRVIPGGVNSPVRSFNGVGGNPIFFNHANGQFLYDQDGNKYLDFVGSWGPMVLGHAHPAVITAVIKAAEHSLSYGAPTELEVALAEKIIACMPSIELIRMVNSGTEATMTAIRLARGFTGKNKIIKLAGCYHGHNDPLLVQAGSGALTLGVPSSPGIPVGTTQDTLIAQYNDLESIAQCFEQHSADIAAIILEPIPGNMGMLLPKPGFLQGLRELCDRYHSLLIFDEVMSGFRVALGGAQAIYNITPDLTTLGKVIGGGMPVGAIGGRQDIMEKLAPCGPVYQAGTLSGNPIAMTAGLATLEIISKPGFFENLQLITDEWVTGLEQVAANANIPLQAHGLGGMFGFFFTDQNEVNCFANVKACNHERFKTFFHQMLNEGVYFAPSSYEAGFISAAHTAKDIRDTLTKTAKVFDLL